MEEDELKEQINSWFVEEENVCSIRSFLKNLLLQRIIEEDKKININFQKVLYDSFDVSIAFLVTDFMLQYHFHYSLSVFSSEIFSTTLREHFLDYFNKISYKWEPAKPPKLDYPVVCDILSSMEINPSGQLGANIIDKYFLRMQGSLLKIIISSIKRVKHFDYPSRLVCSGKMDAFDSKCVGTDTSLFCEDKIKKLLWMKEVNLKKKINIHKREFSRCRQVLHSCNESLNIKFNEAKDLIAEMKQLRNSIQEEVHFVRNHCQLIDDINKRLLSISKLEHESMDVKKTPQRPEHVDGCCQTELAVENEINLTYVDVGVQVVVDTENSLSQTDMTSDYISRLENKKKELGSFIDHQVETIHDLTDKTETLNSIVNSVHITDIANSRHQNMTPHKEANEKNPCQSGLCRCHQFETMLDCYTFSINTMKNKFELLRNFSEETENNYKSFINKHANS